MMPVVFRIPFLERDVPGYGLMLMIGFLLAIVWAARRAARSGADPDVILNCGFIALIAGIVGCRAMYVIHYWDTQFAIRGDWLAVLWGIVDVTRGGLEFYGGFLLSSVCVLFYLWRWGHSVRWYLDIVAPSAALGLAFGRIGCLLNGCCYGNTCDLPWSIQFPYGSAAAQEHWLKKLPGAELPQELLYTRPNGGTMPILREHLAARQEELAKARAAEEEASRKLADAKKARDAATDAGEQERLAKQVERLEQRAKAARITMLDVRGQMDRYHLTLEQLRALAAQYPSRPVHPSQIYTAIYAGLLALFLSALYWRRVRDGQVICTLFLIEPIARYLLETLRADNPQDVSGFTLSQALAVGMTLVGVFGLLSLRLLPARSRSAKLWVPPPEEAAAKSKPPAGGKASAAA